MMKEANNLELIIRKANHKIAPKGWIVYEDDVRHYGDYVRLFYQAKSLVEDDIFDEDATIYGIGIFLVNKRTHQFYPVASIEEIERTAERLNAT